MRLRSGAVLVSLSVLLVPSLPSAAVAAGTVTSVSSSARCDALGEKLDNRFLTWAFLRGAGQRRAALQKFAALRPQIHDAGSRKAFSNLVLDMQDGVATREDISALVRRVQNGYC